MPGMRARLLFDTIAPSRYIATSDVGWDVGSFIEASKQSEADAGFYLGGVGYWRLAGVLKRLADAWRRFGPDCTARSPLSRCRRTSTPAGSWRLPSWWRPIPIPFPTGPAVTLSSGTPKSLVADCAGQGASGQAGDVGRRVRPARLAQAQEHLPARRSIELPDLLSALGQLRGGGAIAAGPWEGHADTLCEPLR